MSENKNSARRRKAFADFKENQYDASFSLSKEQKRKKRAAKIFRWIFIIIIIAVFISAGFVLTDALLNISQQPYEDTNTYTASFTTTTTTTVAETTQQSANGQAQDDGDEQQTNDSQESSDGQTQQSSNITEQQ